MNRKSKMPHKRPTVLIATLGTRPQVVTLALDHLFTAHDIHFAELCVIHTDPHTEPIKSAVTQLDKSFQRFHQINTSAGEDAWEAVYHYHRTKWPYEQTAADLNYRRVTIERLEPQPGRMPASIPITDVETEANSQATFRTIFNVVSGYKKQGAIIHFCIAGGRKSMSVFGLAAAQMLFEQSDKLWHIVSKMSLVKTEAMHDRDHKSALVPVDLVYMGEYLTAANRPLVDDPYKLIRAQQAYVHAMHEGYKTAFVDNLDDVDREILLGVAGLLGNSRIGKRLSDKRRAAGTVADRITKIHRNYLAFLDEQEVPLNAGKRNSLPRPLLIAEFASYFERRGMQLRLKVEEPAPSLSKG